MGGALVTEIHIYPVKGEPGGELSVADVEPEGLAGDRRKRAAVQLVAAEDVQEDTRANVIVSMTSGELAGVSRVGAARRRRRARGDLGPERLPRGLRHCQDARADQRR